ncbi:MAG TPA: hypothetical protein PKK18_09660 [Chitinophagales bacterium]|nr:hypothetical protein [Chitinophagales bacterium]HMW13029.1 hypothetical protein [Chitinophagales bacterium]HMX60727.1 hypothetical protein [Chitinophagales bacterium]HMY23036.1 hypothetical protein [Chitinophagales bacterium]HMZ34421.1 hypothetical protein [Chitinophagales bacterium]
MDIQTRKIAFVQSFLQLQSEETIAQLEELLVKLKKREKERKLRLLSIKELNDRIAQSEKDFKNNKFKPSAELLAKYQ